MTVGLAGAMTDVLAAFRAAGVRATADGRDVNAPCVVVAWPVIEWVAGKGRAHLTWTAYLVVGDAGSLQALALMSDLLAKVNGLWSTTRAQSLPYNPPGGGDPLPAYQLTWQHTATL